MTRFDSSLTLAQLNRFGSLSNDDDGSEGHRQGQRHFTQESRSVRCNYQSETQIAPTFSKQSIIRNLTFLFCRGWLRKCGRIYNSGAEPLISSIFFGDVLVGIAAVFLICSHLTLTVQGFNIPTSFINDSSTM